MWKQVYRDSDIVFHNFKKDKVLEGAYVSKEENQGQRKNSTIHHFDVEGQEVTCWGTTVLDGKLASVEKHYGFDAKVKITYKGEVEPKKGGKSYHDFDVEAWVADDSVRVKDGDIPVIDEDKPIDLKDIPF